MHLAPGQQGTLPRKSRTSIVLVVGALIALALVVVGATRGPARTAQHRPAQRNAPAAVVGSPVQPSPAARAAVPS